MATVSASLESPCPLYMATNTTTDHRSIDEGDSQPPSKKPRIFVARQACEHCRQKKTRCDEDFPCSLCRSLGIECKYGDRKATRNEASFSTVFSFLKRIESKVEKISSQTLEDRAARWAAPATPRESLDAHWPNHGNHFNTQLPISPSVVAPSPCVSTAASSPSNGNPISFSAHKVLDWPSVAASLPAEAKSVYQAHGTNYAVMLEMKRPSLPPLRRNSMASDHSDLDQLSVSVIRIMCNTFFATFNLANPILDQKFFMHHTLAKAIQKGFDYDIESCVVLAVMALGCWGMKALEEAGFAPSTQRDPSLDVYLMSDIPGLYLFNESRMRQGFLANDNGMQSCQYHLLCGLFYAQLVRPVDWWVSTTRAATCSLTFWECMETMPDDWITDMQSRLYWIAVMFEAVLMDELSLPASRLGELQETVPLPRFVQLNSYSSILTEDADTEDNSFYHYHFLSQIVHRILVTRTRNSIYFSSPIGNYPPPSLEAELTHQLQQWRNQLPTSIQFDDDYIETLPTCPKDILVVPLLRSRYMIQKIHLGRPLLHRVLSRPDLRTPADLQRCNELLNDIMAWKHNVKLFLNMRNCLPLKFNICAQLFGHLLIVYCFKNNDDQAVVEVVPQDYQSWCSFALEFLEECAPLSPTVGKDAQIASILCRNLIHEEICL